MKSLYILMLSHWSAIAHCNSYNIIKIEIEISVQVEFSNLRKIRSKKRSSNYSEQ